MKVDCQWGKAGAAQPADVVIIVDVLSFSTSVVIAAERNARVFPWSEAAGADALATVVGGRAASRKRNLDAPSLSPTSLMKLAEGEALVLPSPNGALCSLSAAAPHVFCGSLRNAAAVAELAAEAGESVLVVPAGETWPDGSMRVAFEDLVGAGAIISRLDGTATPEAQAAAAAFADAQDELLPRLLACPSGLELVNRGFKADVELSADLDVSPVAPMLMLYRQRYRMADPASGMGGKRIRYFDRAV